MAYLPGTNTGHGHVWERPDGIKARCGGRGLCQECSADEADRVKAREMSAETIGANLDGFDAGWRAALEALNEHKVTHFGVTEWRIVHEFVQSFKAACDRNPADDHK